MVTVDTVNIYNVKTRRILTKSISICNTQDKWIGDNNYGLEKKNMKYIKKELKL